MRQAAVFQFIYQDKDEFFAEVELERDVKHLRENYRPVQHLGSSWYISVLKFYDAIRIQKYLIRAQSQKGKDKAIDQHESGGL